MTIREAKKNDLKQIGELFDGYRVFYKKTTDIEGGISFLKERLENQDSKLFIAENDEQEIVGFVQLYPLFSSTRMQKLWLLNDLFVHADHRGKQVSKQLIEKAKQLVRDSSACGMFLETEKSNLIGNNLYPETGFEKNNGSNFYEWNNLL